MRGTRGQPEVSRTGTAESELDRKFSGRSRGGDEMFGQLLLAVSRVARSGVLHAFADVRLFEKYEKTSG